MAPSFYFSMDSPLAPWNQRRSNQSYRPFQVEYHHAQAGEPLDFVLIDLHGGKVDDFYQAHEDLEPALSVNRDLLRAICRAEADTCAPELVRATGEVLARKGHAVGMLYTQLPRGLIDVGRIPKLAFAPVFEANSHPSIFQRHQDYYHQAIAAQACLLSQLRQDFGFWLNVHTMRSHNKLKDQGSFPKNEDAREIWLQEHLEDLRRPDWKGDLREICFVSAEEHGEERIQRANPILLRTLQAQFKSNNIPYAENDPYALTSRLPEYRKPSHYARGVLIDIVKRALGNERGAGLEDMEPDAQAIEFFAELCATAMIEARNRTLEALDRQGKDLS